MRAAGRVVVLAALLVLTVVGALPAAASDVVEIVALSNRADVVSGGDVLLEVTVPERSMRDGLVVTVDGRDVTDAFGVTGDDRLIGLVEGLALGENVGQAEATDGRGARLTVTNHPVGGPVFAGPQVQPWVCQTVEAGLGEPLDDQCNAATVVSYRYKNLAGSFSPYDPDSPPPDVAMTTTDRGVTVPYIIRVERGVIDRGMHNIAVLADPTAPWTAVEPQPGWNGKLVWAFGGGTGPGHNQALPPGIENDSALSRGFMVATSSLTIHGKNANDTVSAEIVMMTKEHIAEQYGEIRYTIGAGCSGGGLQQHIIADTYPGLLDGLLPNCSYPDIWTTAMEVVDCSLLTRYFNDTAPELWAVVAQRAFAAGHQDIGSCIAWDELFGPRFDATNASNCDLDPALVYDPATNPSGTRCTLTDYQIAIWGRRPADRWGPVEQELGTGFANVPVSNVGVQYGLAAVEDGTILVEQFVDLNERIGGLDVDGAPQPERITADPGATATAYRTGQVVQGLHLDEVPIIDLRGHDNTEIHTDVYSRITAARLVAANGHGDNQAVWTGPLPLVGEPEWVSCGLALEGGLGNADLELPDSPVPCSETSPLLTMDAWLAAIEADDRDVSLAAKVLDNRPAHAVDACYVNGQQVTDEAICAGLYPVFETTRMVAGGPVTNDVIECQLVPLDRGAYSVSFTDEQWARMEAAFPTGVCDYTQPGVGQQPPVGTWLSFPGEGAAPVVLGAAPVSVPYGPGIDPAAAGGDSLAATGPRTPLTVVAAVALGAAASLRRRRSPAS